MKMITSSQLRRYLLKCLLLLTISFASCELDPSDKDDSESSIQFKLGGVSTNTSGAGRTTSDQNPVAIMIEFAALEGTDTLDSQFQTIPLYQFGEGYVSELIELAAGNYVLLQFLVLGDQNKILYAAPLKNSDLAGLVNYPLPIAFTVGSGSNVVVDVEVLEMTATLDSENFGYAAFSFNIAQPELTKVIKVTGKVYLVYDDHDVIKGRVKVGDIVTGEIRYDIIPPRGIVDIPGVSKSYIFRSPSRGMELNVNGYTFKTDPTKPDMHLFIANNWPQSNGIDYLAFGSRNNISPFEHATDVWTSISFDMSDGNHVAISNTDIPASFNPATWAPKNFSVGGITPDNKWAYNIVCSITEMKQ